MNASLGNKVSSPPIDRPPDIDAKLILTSEELFRGGRELAIRHNDTLYRLSITAAGKLILTK